MDAIDINYMLAKKGHTQTEIASSLNVSPSIVHRVITGERASYNIASYIAQTLGCSVAKLWPGQYDKRVA